ncbi:pyridoxamine 5'-phosphate oxidase family protein [Williamsia sp. 1135]|uniref:pyridoxamine 5'-phosphate oxidase family protein n=1 Tax=Williamsia sp. 1135 TaxID=1889262 RepID=UPI000A1185F8|nr:pyridoxamine 5'-phosphate oxidase family protein [Williamsia sp. 1135]ORM34171.1 pyridoxamine 5'-phosphate oxidase [Williamsia sp. 1135]
MTIDTLPQGDLGLMQSVVAQELLQMDIPARLAYTASDGTPRVLPINHWWTGTELVMATFTGAAKVRALRRNPAVAITIDTADAPPHVLLLRGDAVVTDVDGIVPEYELTMRRGMPAGAADEYFAGLRADGATMHRIAVRPTWVGVLDFETRFPGAAPSAISGSD